MFAEFIEAHVNDNTAWIKDALVDLNKSDDDSGVEDETNDSNDNKVLKESEGIDTPIEVKAANAQISDLDVCISKCYCMSYLCLFYW